MIDLHCHILPGVDDGSHTQKSSLTMLEKAAAAGISDVVLTPHYVKGSKYDCDNKTKRRLLTNLKRAAKRRKIEVNLHLGNEIFLDPEILELIKSKQILPLARSSYLLIELPVRAEDREAKSILFDIISSGYRVIIAHPERYLYFQDDPHKIVEYLQLGCYMQGDYLSLIGRYGKHAQKALKYYLKHGYIHFLASDLHHSSEDYKLDKSTKRLRKIVKTDEKVEKLLVGNPEKVLKNQPLA